MKDFRAAKIGQLGNSLLSHKHISPFYIAVNDIIAMQIFEAFQNLKHITTYEIFAEGAKALKHRGDTSARGILQKNVQIPWTSIRSNVPNDVPVL
eukprot:CAMPEP_0171457930 /NCGR_PEP_ID=MMETSP0945-20130129/3806_1 /TAXON_ID=109269 /ORGANISM="Vaucheria litorea, Strain CCMP2940" /LENGTH=94 /DNA_ID=CAMNT_0011983625 /DNA_START=309 /DNA_END=593 /DNA_ORIENTATION=+